MYVFFFGWSFGGGFIFEGVCWGGWGDYIVNSFFFFFFYCRTCLAVLDYYYIRW